MGLYESQSMINMLSRINTQKILHKAFHSFNSFIYPLSSFVLSSISPLPTPSKPQPRPPTSQPSSTPPPSPSRSPVTSAPAPPSDQLSSGDTVLRLACSGSACGSWSLGMWERRRMLGLFWRWVCCSLRCRKWVGGRMMGFGVCSGLRVGLSSGWRLAVAQENAHSKPAAENCQKPAKKYRRSSPGRKFVFEMTRDFALPWRSGSLDRVR